MGYFYFASWNYLKKTQIYEQFPFYFFNKNGDRYAISTKFCLKLNSVEKVIIYP